MGRYWAFAERVYFNRCFALYAPGPQKVAPSRLSDDTAGGAW